MHTARTEVGQPEFGEPELKRTMHWRAGFVLALTVPAGVFASLGYSIGSLGAWTAAALWGTCALIGILQNLPARGDGDDVPDKPGGITLYAQEAWKKYTKAVGAMAAWGFGWAGRWGWRCSAS